jgi:hypothetical protein
VVGINEEVGQEVLTRSIPISSILGPYVCVKGDLLSLVSPLNGSTNLRVQAGSRVSYLSPRKYHSHSCGGPSYKLGRRESGGFRIPVSLDFLFFCAWFD